MANWYSTSRSNYFRVIDEAKFKDWADSLCIEWWQQTVAKSEASGSLGNHFAIAADENGWPSWRFDPDSGDDHEIELEAELAKHLHPDDVAILLEVGNEKLRYITGHAVAVNSFGEIRRINLDDIHVLAGELAPNVSHASY